ncbi:MAG: cell division protein FtsA, partial [Oscillospiraceae bacterium]
QQMTEKTEIVFNDILGFEQTITLQEVVETMKEAALKLCAEIAERIISVNGDAPSAVFLAGGGSKLSGLCEEVARCLNMDVKRVAVAGNNFKICAVSDFYDLNNPEYATPLGIAVSAGMNLINDSFRVMLNGKNAKLFRSGSLSVRDVLMMNGFSFNDLIGRSGENIIYNINGKRTTIYGGHSLPAVLKVNDTDARISQTVHAGDVIIFEPAVHGKDAKATIKDIIGEENSDVILLNGEPVSIDTEIKNGDFIETIPEEKYYQSAMEEYMEEESSLEELLQNEAKQEKATTTAIANTEEPSVQVETEDGEQSQGGATNIIFNGKQLVLEEKYGGYPHFLFDLIEYSDIDLDNPEGEVILKVNGEDGFYQRIIQDGDEVEIYCEKRK